MALLRLGKKPATSVTHLSHAACGSCDLLLTDVDVPSRFDLTCPRCKTVVFHNRSSSLEREYALVLTGLLLFLPAISLPIINMTPYGQNIDVNMMDGVLIFLDQRAFIVAGIVFLSAIVAPFLNLFLLFLVISVIYLDRLVGSSAGAKQGANAPGVLLSYGVTFFRWYQLINPWIMLEVYLMGFLISIGNLDKALVNPGAVPGLGFYAFCVVMLVSILSSLTLNSHYVWQCLDRRWEE
ncbi:MAG: hypothetical protein COB04_06710 [Gammaproteobacteria bacterium]|nr:MAG: hypothetical protein COB04_06710 [Gammaproteobacteria bacterium]